MPKYFSFWFITFTGVGFDKAYACVDTVATATTIIPAAPLTQYAKNLEPNPIM